MFSLSVWRNSQLFCSWFRWVEQDTLERIFQSFSVSSWWGPWKIECLLTNKQVELTREQMTWIQDEIMFVQKQEIKTLDELERFLKLKSWS
jgi:hypothetical protein